MAAQLALFEMEPVRRHRAPATLGHATVREIDVKSILQKGSRSLSGFDFSLNPYAGCTFGCSYCYASAFQADEGRRADWGKWVDVKANAVELIRGDWRLAGATVYMGSVTDPYQPIEMQVGLSRAILQAMLCVYPQPRLVVQTRSPLVVRDADLLRQFESVRVNVSVPTDDDLMRKRFEPSAPSIERRLKTLRMLKATRVKTGVCISPMLPLRDPWSFAETLKALNPERVGWSWFHSNSRPFAADTPTDAWRKAAAVGWTREKYEEQASVLERAFRGYEDEVFEPTFGQGRRKLTGTGR